MLEVVLPIAVLAMLLLFVSQVRRLIAHAILNGTIRKAMQLDPQSAPLLIEKLESQPRWPTALIGAVLLAAGGALTIAACMAGTRDRADAVEVGLTAAAIGLAILLYSWWAARKTRI